MVPQEKRLSLRTCSELAQQRCRFVPVNALSWAITLLAVAIGVVAQADKNFQHYELFSSNKRSAEILQQLDASGYITSLTNYGGVGIDLRLASKMVRNQQLWRRQYESNKKERKIQYSLLDCNPLFAAQRSVLSWFRIVTLKVALCAHVCQDYPTCTMTTPLIEQWKARCRLWTKTVLYTPLNLQNLPLFFFRSLLSLPFGSGQLLIQPLSYRVLR